jgi:ERCC4-related helicase
MCQEHFMRHISTHPAILLNAPVGSGKTTVAAALALLVSGHTMAYMCKILFLSPLVELVKAQVLFFRALARVLNTNVRDRFASGCPPLCT